MGSCCGGSAPQPPNPIQTAAAQTGTNVSTAVANAFLNNTNQSTPQGTLSYDVSGNYSWTDPSTGQTYNIPRFTANQQLTPAGQQLQQTDLATQQNLGNLAQSQSGRLGSLLGNPFNLDNTPTAGNAWNWNQAAPLSSIGQFSTPDVHLRDFADYATQVGSFGADVGSPLYNFDNAGSQQTGFGDAGQQQSGFDPTGNITGTYDNQQGDAQRARVEQSLFQRMQPQNQLALSQLQSQLANQGIRYGSDAYTAAMDNYNRGINDQMLGITAQGGQEQQLQAGLAQNLAGFQNTAQQQAYAQAQGRGQFANAAQAAAFAQAQARGQFANTAQQQAFAQSQAQGQFTNAAQQQAYQQALGRGQFDNAARAQNLQDTLTGGNYFNAAQQNLFGQAATSAQFTNAALQQQLQEQQAQFAAQNQQRTQYLQEQYALRNQPINETTALLSGSQVQQPTFTQTPQQQIPTTDIAGLINTQFNQQFGNYQTQSALLGNIIGAAGQVGRGIASASDRTLKENVHKLGTVFAADNAGDRRSLPIYQFSYKDDPASTRHIGPMAQDVERIDPGAVHTIPAGPRAGKKAIDSSRVMGGILRAA